MKTTAIKMIKTILEENMPTQAVENALKNHQFKGNIHMVAIGKAAWTMAKAASDYLGDKLVKGIVVTKYDHSQGSLPGIEIYEAGHPVSDENTVLATDKCIELAQSLTADDELLFLVSGGGSALFESPLPGLNLEDIQDVTSQFLAKGADIVEINMVRKRLSKVKAGRFAQLAAPARVFSIVLSDVLGDRLDSIASGPAHADSSTLEDAFKVIEKYKIKMPNIVIEETPKYVDNVKTIITGSVRTLCESAAKTAKSLGYEPYILSTTINCEAKEAGRFLSSIAADIQNGNSSIKKPCVIIAGGETVVTIKGSGKGGRNQELALSAAKGIAGLDNILIFSLGSDGTDGPTDAAGGIVDGQSYKQLKDLGLDIDEILENNDSYNGLKAIDGLIITGPTGTNVNDVAVIIVS